MDDNALPIVLCHPPTPERKDPRWLAEELSNRLLTLSPRELDWVLELLGFLKEESWRPEHEDIACTVAAILVPREHSGMRSAVNDSVQLR